MTIRTFGALLCGALLVLATSSGGNAASETKKENTKAQATVNASMSNVKSPPECKKAGGVWNKTTKTCAARP